MFAKLGDNMDKYLHSFRRVFSNFRRGLMEYMKFDYYVGNSSTILSSELDPYILIYGGAVLGVVIFHAIYVYLTETTFPLLFMFINSTLAILIIPAMFRSARLQFLAALYTFIIAVQYGASFSLLVQFVWVWLNRQF